MNLYPKNDTPTLDLQLFQNPTAEYRGTPFWSWNSKLDRGQLLRQIEILKAMGMGGFHMHARTGLATEYLGDEFMELVRACVEKARQEHMLAWLYDEDRWPSGFAGGLVTREPQFRAKHLLFTCVPYGEPAPPPFVTNTIRAGRSTRTGGQLIARYQVLLREGRLAAYRRLQDGEPAPEDGRIWYAYLESPIESPWFNNQTYVDTLSKPAIERFVAITHERYAEVVGHDFGGVIPAIFTDEPQFMHKRSLRRADDRDELVIPWTPDLLETYLAAYGQRLEEHLPELFWELPDGKVSLARYCFHDHVTERFVQAFADTLGDWCDAHGLMLTGHMMEEPTLESQTTAIGEAMRSYRGFALPGIDMLCDRREYTTAKQAQSAAHQYGRPGVLSELYGVTNWDFDFVGHKAQGDWQAALGVTVRVHHLAWVAMAGEAKRDYPAAIGYQSPWWHEYRLVEDHFARLNTALTRGRPLVRVGVVHPIESYWLCYGPLDQTAVERAEREHAFAELTNWLLFGLIDFDFIAESLLPGLCPSDQEPITENQELGQSSRFSVLGSRFFQVGQMRYDTVLIPPLRTIRATTLERLEAFQAGGGMVIFAGEAPDLVDAVPSERARELALRSRRVAFARGAILEALDSARELSARQADGSPADTLLHQIRVDGERRFVFFCNTDREHARPHTRIALAGAWRVTMLDTLTGTSAPLRASVHGGATCVDWSFAPHGSLLLELAPLAANTPVERSEAAANQANPGWQEIGRLGDPVPITLSEPNVLLLDQAAYRLNDEEWQPTEEILRLDTALRRRLGLPVRMAWVAQPWTDPNPAPPTDTLSLMFTVQVDVPVDAPMLALENAAQTRIELDGQPLPSDVAGWFVDEAIQTVRLPGLAAGTHKIALTMPYGRTANPEWCYLLGDFGVEVRGRHARIGAPVRELAFGDWTRQGLPFYAGNVTYHCTIEGRSARLAVKAPKFKAPLLSVALDGQAIGKIAFAPFQIDLSVLADGPHVLDITAYGNRVNAFGCVHNADERWYWFGPNAWRTTGDDWSYEYQLKPMGLLVAPQILA